MPSPTRRGGDTPRARSRRSGPPRRWGRARRGSRRPAASTVSALGTKPSRPRRTEISSVPSGISRSPTLTPAAFESSGSSISMISSRCSGRSSRWTSPYSGTSCSIRRRIRSVAETVGPDAQQLEVLAVARVVDAGDDPLDEVLLLRHLADQHVVLVVAGDRDHHVGARDPGPLEHPQLGRVAVLDVVLELLLDRRVALAVRPRSGSPRALLDQLARQVPADLAGADDDRVHGARPSDADVLVVVGVLVRRPRPPGDAPGSCPSPPRGPAARASRSRPCVGQIVCSALVARTTRPAAGRGPARSPSAPRTGASRSGR